MNIEPTYEPSIAVAQTTALRDMTIEELRDLGACEVAYVRSGRHGNELIFLLFGADGLPCDVANTLEAVVRTAAEQGLSFVAVH